MEQVMARSRRAERRQRKRNQKRADALARTPKMLADEQSLRADLDALNRLARRIGEHSKYDNAIQIRSEEMHHLADDLTRGSEQLLNVILQLGVRRLLPESEHVADDNAGCPEAMHLLATYEGRVDRAKTIASEAVDLILARADLGTQSVDRVQLAAGLYSLAGHVETLEASVERFRQLIDHECSAGDKA
jgi:hypothetical protein